MTDAALAIEARGLTRRFGRSYAVRDVDLSVPRGSLFGLLGPSGAGKSTTYGMLLGFLKPTAGDAIVLGRSIRRGLPSGRIGCVSQDAALDSTGPVGETLRRYARLQGVPRRDVRRQVGEALERFDVARFERRSPHQLSHGQLKRVLVAQALIGAPELVLVDEPTAGLDPLQARKVLEALREHAGEHTVVVTSNYVLELEGLCDEVAVLVDGRVALAGTVSALRVRGNPGLVVQLAEACAPSAELAARLAAAELAWEPGLGPRQLRLRFQRDDMDPTEAMCTAARLLDAAGHRVHSVMLGRSLLETCLLEAERDAHAGASP